MNKDTIIYSTFKFKWIVKSTTLSIAYKKAYKTTTIDEVFCSIVASNDGQISKSIFGELLGFNISNNPEESRFKDLSEEEIFNYFLNSVYKFQLLEEDNNIIYLTDDGKRALETNLKYEYLFASAEVFHNKSLDYEKGDFPFDKIFNLDNNLSNIKEEEIKDFEIVDNAELYSKLQYQLFKHDIFQGELLHVFDKHNRIEYHEFELTCQLIPNNNSFQIRILDNDTSLQELDELLEESQNYKIQEELIHKGKFQNLIDQNTILGVKELSDFLDLWDWKEIPIKYNVNWDELEVLELFKENGFGDIWKSISELIEIESIKKVINKYSEYWDWRILTKRLDNGFIFNNIDKYSWDFEILSFKEIEFVTQLLSDEKLISKDWDWDYLTENLPSDYVIENIDRLPWNFYQLTTSKLDVFKTVFNKDTAGQLIKPWDWTYVSKEIKIDYLYRNISKFANQIDWKIVLDRFFNDIKISQKCISDSSFKKLLKDSIPESFNIDHENYIWDVEIVSFFDELSLINWETYNFIKGFDTNENVIWKRELFIKFSHKIITDEGHSNVSNLIEDKTLILEFPDFPWDWNRISQNQLLISDIDFLQNNKEKLNWHHISSSMPDEVILKNYRNFPWSIEKLEKRSKEFIKQLIENYLPFDDQFNWGDNYSLFDVSYWIKNIKTFVKKTDTENVWIKAFWEKFTKDCDYDFVINNIEYPWNWSIVTEEVIPGIILESFDHQELMKKWDWGIATRKLDRISIIENLEIGTPYWDWQYLIKNIFEPEDLTLEGNGKLIRIATCLSTIDPEIKKKSWESLTSQFSIENLYDLLEITSDFNVFEWDWDYISSQKHLPTDLESLSNFADKLNWSILAESEAIQKKFSYINWGKDKKGCFETILNYLTKFLEYWDWSVLSKNSDIHWDRRLLEIFRDQNWDWDYLSENGDFLKQSKRDRDNYLISLLRKFPVNFDLFSSRNDLKIPSSVIHLYRNRNWNFDKLSKNNQAEITFNLLVELSDKNWDWESLSCRHNIELDNLTLIQLKDKKWDWEVLAKRKDIVFNIELFQQTIEKPWSWKNISRNKSFNPSIEVLNYIKNFELDWAYISSRPDLNPTRELLSKFEDKLVWSEITKHAKIDFGNIDFIKRFIAKWDWDYISRKTDIGFSAEWLNTFKDYLNWSQVCKLGNLILDENNLSTYANYLDWNLISENTTIKFSENLILKYEPYWNWYILKNNHRVSELVGDFVDEKIKSSPKLFFLSSIEEQYSSWKGYIYHYTHIDNAVEIIKNRKIQSRNRAKIKGDSAGSVVHRRNDAHNYARFYFRPHTPTQFYNEYLGKDKESHYYKKEKINIPFSGEDWIEVPVYYYEKARNLGFPKCPVPIFFKFSLKEVLHKNIGNCYMGNGNMQTNTAILGKFENMVDKMYYDQLFMDFSPSNWEDYLRYSQQEFLVKDELSFNDFIDIEIICPKELDKELLSRLIGNENSDILSKIKVNNYLYNNDNPRVDIQETDDKISISTNFRGDGNLLLYSDNSIHKGNIIEGDVVKVKDEKVIFKSHLTVTDIKGNLEIKFLDESNREWFIFKKHIDNIISKKTKETLGINLLSSSEYEPQAIIDFFKQIGYADDYNTQVRHYSIERHTLLVCHVFEKYFAQGWNNIISIEAFRIMLILHDIGKARAFIKGDKNKQYEFTKEILKELQNVIPIQNDEFEIITKLLAKDSIGSYFQEIQTLESTVNDINEQSNGISISPSEFLYLLFIYYQCDTAAYTKDEGGFTFLEKLFQYDNNRKIYDNDLFMLKFSEKYQVRYFELIKQFNNEN